MEIVIQLLTNHLIPYLFSMGLYIFAIRWEGLTLRGLVLFLCVDWDRIDCSLLFISCVLSLGMEWDSGEDRFSWIKEQQRVRT